jgi:N-ethylmaleimide reductase
MKTISVNKLFTPVQVGPMELKHRVVMAPLTRSRSVQPGNIPGDLMLEYYSQRASDGGLIVSEGTSISIAGGGWFGAPGLYSDAQVAGWRRITDAVHGKRGHMFSQLWHTGRAAHVDSTNGVTPVSSSVNAEYWHDPTIQESTPSRMATAFASPCAGHHRNAGHCRRLSQSGRACKSGEF